MQRRITPLVSAAALVAVCVYFAWSQLLRPAQEISPPGQDSVVEQVASAAPLLTDITKASGLEFVHSSGNLNDRFFPSIMCGGCALFDYDLDGRPDIYLVNGNDQLPGVTSAKPGPVATNALYWQSENGMFMDVTDGSGLGDAEFGMGVAVGDINNDGFPDVYVTNYGPDHLYLNQKDGTFVDITKNSGIENLQWSASATFVDFDRDGWLDLYVTNYVDYYAERQCPDANGRAEFCGPQTFFPVADRLFQNITGQSTSGLPTGESVPVRFRDVSLSSGIAAQSAAGLGVVCADFNQDHWPDIYVANDRMANHLWVNQQNGSFVDEAVLRGAAFDSQGRPQAGMGIAAGDVNGDQVTDLLVTHIEGESNALYLSSRPGIFREESASQQLLIPSYPRTGFATAFTDLNHDTYPDIVIVNGRVKRSEQTQPNSDSTWSLYGDNNLIFLNDAAGGWIPSNENEPFCKPAEVSRGLAVGDIDNDGDIDLLMTNVAASPRLFRNDAAKSGGWLKVRAIDQRFGGRDAYGAEVTVVAGDSHWTATIHSAIGYLSASLPIAHFGTGTAEQYDRIEVVWPDGLKETFEGGPCCVMRKIERGIGKEAHGISGE